MDSPTSTVVPLRTLSGDATCGGPDGDHLVHVPMSRLARTSVLGDWTVILVSFEMSNGYSGSYDSGLYIPDLRTLNADLLSSRPVSVRPHFVHVVRGIL